MEINKYQEDAVVPVDEILITFEAQISQSNPQFLKISGIQKQREKLAYEKQCQFLDKYCGDNEPHQIGEWGVQVFKMYNATMQKNLPVLLQEMSELAGVEVTYSLMTEHSWQDVTYDMDLDGHRVMTEEELIARYFDN